MVVTVTREEQRRIIDAGWPGRLAGQRLFHRFKRQVVLAHQPDGACVFLADDGKCRLHAESGEAVKPLTCRLFPFVLTPGVGGVRLDLRADCPSVAANKGRSLPAHAKAIRAFADELGARSAPDEWDFSSSQSVSSDESVVVLRAFDSMLTHRDLSHRDRWRTGAALLDLLYQVRVRKVRGGRFTELMSLLTENAILEAQSAEQVLLPDKIDRLFRQWLFLHAWVETRFDLGPIEKLRRSWARYRESRAFVRGVGAVPQWMTDNVTFEQVAAIQPAADADLEPVLRIMRVKLDAHAVAGRSFYGLDLLRGLTALWLTPALTGWFARLNAAGRGGDTLTADDIVAGVTRTHRTFGVSPVFGRFSERLRLAAFARPGVPAAVLNRYGP